MIGPKAHKYHFEKVNFCEREKSVPEDHVTVHHVTVDLVKYNEMLINDMINSTRKQLDQIEGYVERLKDVGCAERRAEEMKQPWRDGVARRSSVLGLVIIWKLHWGES